MPPPPPTHPFSSPPSPPGSPPPSLPPHAPGHPHAPPCSLTGADLVSFVFYMQALFSAFQQLCSIFTSLATAVGAADSVVKWVERKPTILPPSHPLTPTSCRGDVKLTNVTFRYALRPEKPILRGLSLHAAPGEVVALCGPSGGGKSTVIALLERFYTPEAGNICLVLYRQSHPWLLACCQPACHAATL